MTKHIEPFRYRLIEMWGKNEEEGWGKGDEVGKEEKEEGEVYTWERREVKERGKWNLIKRRDWVMNEEVKEEIYDKKREES